MTMMVSDISLRCERFWLPTAADVIIRPAKTKWRLHGYNAISVSNIMSSSNTARYATYPTPIAPILAKSGPTIYQ